MSGNQPPPPGAPPGAPPVAPPVTGKTPALYMTPQNLKHREGLTPSLLDVSLATTNTTSSASGSSCIVHKSYKTNSSHLRRDTLTNGTSSTNTPELQNIVDSVGKALDDMVDEERQTKDLISLEFEPQGCKWIMEFNPSLRADSYRMQVICLAAPSDVSSGATTYVLETTLEPKCAKSGRLPEEDPGLGDAKSTFEQVVLQVRKAVVRCEFPDFPEGCKGKPFREVYQLNARLKSGSFATVCRGTHRASGKKVAIKCVLRKDLPPSDDAAIFDEVSILASLHHPYICPLIDFFEEKDCYFLVMELMAGGDLFDRIGEKKSYSEGDARDLCKKMFQAIAYCHENDVAHCDMKPKNLLLTSEDNDSEIKLADFGFAARVYSPNSLTKQCGTPFFVSPEILMRKGYDQKSDMWSVGCIVYLLLGGNLPFMGRSQKELFRTIVVGKYDFPDDCFHDVTDHAKDLVRRLLVTDPDQRISSQDALKHVWMQDPRERLARLKLLGTSQRLKTFNARMKLRSAMIAVDFGNSLRRLSVSGSAFGSLGSVSESPTDSVRSGMGGLGLGSKSQRSITEEDEEDHL